MLLPHHPVPVPNDYDEFGHLLVTSTLLYGRLANPAHPMHRFFETFFTLQQPTYSSMYPIGQGLMLAVGSVLFSTPWAVVLLSTAAFCSLCFWMLRGWVSPAWALAGRLLAVFEFGPLCPWMNSYWGGEFRSCRRVSGVRRSAAISELFASALRGRARHGVGASLAASPFRIALFVSLRCSVSASAISESTAGQNPGAANDSCRSRPGSACVGDYLVTQSQRDRELDNASLSAEPVPFQTNPTPHADLTAKQELGYQSRMTFRSSGRETFQSY